MKRYLSKSKWRTYLETLPCALDYLLLPHIVLSQAVGVSLTKVRDAPLEVKLTALQSKEMAACYVEFEEGNCTWTVQERRQITEVLILLTSDANDEVREKASRYLIGSTDSRAVQPLGRLLKD